MQIEQSLKDSEIRYRRLFEAAQDGILILDAKTGMIEDVNPYLIRMLGYSREEFVKKRLWEVGAFKDIEASKDAFEVLQVDEYIRYEDLPLKTKDGRLIQVEFVSNVYLVGGEKVIQCNIRDTTEHRRIVALLQANEKKYHDLINQSPDGYFIIELSGNILTANEAMCKELEFSEEEFLSLHIWDIIPEQYLDQYKERLTKVLKGESLKEAAEYEVRGKNGKVHYVEVLSAPRYSGRDVIGFQGVARDITARKEAENALQESEARNRRLVEHLPTVVYMNAVGDASSTLYVSPQIEALLGYTPQEWLADPKLWSKTLHPEDRQRVLEQVSRTDQSNEPFEMEYRMIARDGRLVWVHDQIVLMKDLEGNSQFWQGIMLDITGRKQAEQKLQESEKRFRALVENNSDAITLVDARGIALYDSPSAAGMLGYAPEDWIGRDAFALIHPDDLSGIRELFQKLVETPSARVNSAFRLRHQSGAWLWIEMVATNLLAEPAVQAIVLNYHDITGRKEAEDALHESEERFKSAFQYSAIGMALVSLEGNWLKVNSTLCSMVGYSEEELLTKTFQDITHPDDLGSDLGYLKQLLAGEIVSYTMEKRYFHKEGKTVSVLLAVALARDNAGAPLYLISQIEDITERKRAEEDLVESEERYRSLFETSLDAIMLTGPDGSILSANSSACKMFEQTEGEIIQAGRSGIVDMTDPRLALAMEELNRTGKFIGELRLIRKGGKKFPGEISTAIFKGRSGLVRTSMIIRDITERKQAVDALQERQRLLSEAQRIGHIGSWSYDILTDTLQCSDEMYRLLDTSSQEFQHNMAGLASLIYASDQPMLTKWVEEIRAGRQVKELDFRFFRKTGELCYLQTRGAVIFDSAGDPVRFIGMAQDVSERKLAEIQIRQQIQRLTALSEIDQAIISTSTLSIKMKTILSHLVVQLQVDAADILLLNDDSQLLEYLAGSGFRTQAYENAHMSVAGSLAGRVIRERRPLKVENLKDQPDDPLVSIFLAKEGFVSYYAVPLITNGKVKGALEVFHRAALHPYAEWFDFLNILVGQAAIAIENASLVTNLEHSNRELSQAYDATIEGWSRALDLRDKETEGHSQRVTEMTVNLMRAFGSSEADLVQVRWGSLLHDIGKMGVPDGILLKPGPLTDEEWVAMKKHPMFAYEMLVPIRYLKLALDIPYCHHEKWDGTGYPRGLKGEEIPLSARIFAVVDVWDALCSDRTYRPRWPVEKVREHIRALSGTHFDPQVATRFLQAVE